MGKHTHHKYTRKIKKIETRLGEVEGKLALLEASPGTDCEPVPTQEGHWVCDRGGDSAED